MSYILPTNNKRNNKRSQFIKITLCHQVFSSSLQPGALFSQTVFAHLLWVWIKAWTIFSPSAIAKRGQSKIIVKTRVKNFLSYGMAPRTYPWQDTPQWEGHAHAHILSRYSKEVVGRSPLIRGVFIWRRKISVGIATGSYATQKLCHPTPVWSVRKGERVSKSWNNGTTFAGSTPVKLNIRWFIWWKISTRKIRRITFWWWSTQLIWAFPAKGWGDNLKGLWRWHVQWSFFYSQEIVQLVRVYLFPLDGLQGSS